MAFILPPNPILGNEITLGNRLFEWDGEKWISKKFSISQNLEDLSDVTITTPANGEVIVYENGMWLNKPQSGGGGATTLGDLTDVDTTGATTDGTQYALEWDVTNTRYNLTEVTGGGGGTLIDGGNATSTHTLEIDGGNASGN
jgi:hypothetical protein